MNITGSLVLSAVDDPGPSATVFGMPDWLCWIIIALLLICSAIFSASENAFSNCNKYHFKVLASQGKITAKIIVRLSEKFEDTLVSVLVGNNIAQTIMSFISAVLFYNLCNAYGLGDSVEAVLSTIVMASLLYIVADTIPKILSKSIPDKMVYVLAWPDFIVEIIFYPIILFFRLVLKLVHKVFKIKETNMLSKEDFVMAADEAISDENIVNPDEKLLEPNEMEILKKAFSFDSISIESVFTPLNQMVYITNKDLTIEKINQIILNSSFSRFPVFDLEKNEFVGIFSINRYFKEYAKDRHLDIRSVVLEPVFAYLDDKVDDIFNELNKTRIHLALVKNHQEEVIGMVTMEDILNQLVGQNPNLLPIKKEAKQ